MKVFFCIFFNQLCMHCVVKSYTQMSACENKACLGVVGRCCFGVERFHHIPRPWPQTNPLPAGKKNCCCRLREAEGPAWVQTADSSLSGWGYGWGAPQGERTLRPETSAPLPPRWRRETFRCSGSRCNILCTPLPPDTAASSPSVQTSRKKRWKICDLLSNVRAGVKCCIK